MKIKHEKIQIWSKVTSAVVFLDSEIDWGVVFRFSRKLVNNSFLQKTYTSVLFPSGKAVSKADLAAFETFFMSMIVFTFKKLIWIRMSEYKWMRFSWEWSRSLWKWNGDVLRQKTETFSGKNMGENRPLCTCQTYKSSSGAVVVSDGVRCSFQQSWEVIRRRCGYTPSLFCCYLNIILDNVWSTIWGHSVESHL